MATSILNDQTAQLIITGASAASLVIATQLYKMAQDWFTKSILKKPTKAEQSANQIAVLVGKMIDLHNEANEIKQEFKTEVKAMVTRIVGDIVSEQREAARATSTSKSAPAVHDYKCAGESLKTVLIKMYMTSVDTNGFVKKTPGEWSNLLASLHDSMVAVSNDHYDDWYINPMLPLAKIRSELKLRRATFVGLNDELMNSIRTKSAEMEDRLEANKLAKEALLSDISKA